MIYRDYPVGSRVIVRSTKTESTNTERAAGVVQSVSYGEDERGNPVVLYEVHLDVGMITQCEESYLMLDTNTH